MTNVQQKALDLIEKLNHYSNTIPKKDYKLDSSDITYSINSVSTRYEGLDNYGGTVYVHDKSNPSSPGFPIDLEVFLATYKEIEPVNSEK